MKPSTVLAKFVCIPILAVLFTVGTRAQAAGLIIDDYNGQYNSSNWALVADGNNTYSFSYIFTDTGQAGGCGPSCDGYKILGTLTGTPDSSAVDVTTVDVSTVSNVELLNAANHVVFSSLGNDVYSYTGDGKNDNSSASYFTPGGAYVSGDGLNMNFLLSNSSTFSEYFYVIPWTNGNDGPGSVTIGEQFVSAAPLPSTWTMLLIGFVGLGFFAYRGTNKRSVRPA